MWAARALRVENKKNQDRSSAVAAPGSESFLEGHFTYFAALTGHIISFICDWFHLHGINLVAWKLSGAAVGVHSLMNIMSEQLP